MKKKSFRQIIFLIIIYVVHLIFSLLFSNNYVFDSLLLIFLLIHTLFIFRNNKKMFVLFCAILYFCSSIIICKYLFGGTSLLNNLYSQISGNYKNYNLNLLFNFNYFLILFLNLFSIKTGNSSNYIANKIYNRKLLILIFKIIIIFVLIYHIYNRITYNTTLFEYLFIIFIFAFYITKGDKKEQRHFEFLMILCSIYQLYIGERISILEFFLGDFIINYLDSMNIKKIILSFIIGISFFTIMGVYGDLLDQGKGFSNFTPKYIYKQFSERRFSLDTAVSSYFTSCSMVEVSKYYAFNQRLENFKKYITDYTLFGSKSNYNNLTSISRKYYVHYGGGIIYSYFYFWFGFLGVLIIALYSACLLKRILYNNKKNNMFNELLGIYLISTVPRWYLYNPSTLIRGIIIYFVLYLVFFKYFSQKSNINTNNL